MDPTIAATVIGVLLTVAFGTFATMLAWLRSDTNARFDKVDARSTRWTPASTGSKRRSTASSWRSPAEAF